MSSRVHDVADDTVLPSVSVIMPVRDEERFLRRSLGAVLAQDYPHDLLEVIVVDGGSIDATVAVAREVQRESGHEIVLVDNPAQSTPSSLNIGLSHATGDFVIRVDGHCVIPPDYVSRCIEVLQQSGAECVGGMCVTEAETPAAAAISVAQSSRFGVGNAAFRIRERTAKYVDTVPFGAWHRKVFDAIGNFDEELVRNQDDEFNLRLVQAGGRIWYDPTISSRYYSRASYRGLWKQYFQYGLYKVRVAQKRRGVSSARQLVPPLFVGTLLTAGATSVLTRRRMSVVAVAAPYVIACGLASRRVAAGKNISPVAIARAYFCLHLSYGCGFLWGIVAWRHHWRDLFATRTARVAHGVTLRREDGLR